MARVAYKTDASFFQKLAVGAVGARSVQEFLNLHGHECVELESGALETKIWKEVKRKRVRIPDLVCKKCGRRVESRAKSKPELSMSHSPTEAERGWDFGMLAEDWVAFPICAAAATGRSYSGRLDMPLSVWRERSWVKWKPTGAINVFKVASFRGTGFRRKKAKGVTEGSETQVYWPAVFATSKRTVDRVEAGAIHYWLLCATSPSPA
jgi:hypothetical protein